MKVPSILSLSMFGFALTLNFSTVNPAQSSHVAGEKQVISLEQQPSSDVVTADLPESAKSLAAKAPANFHFFRTAKIGQSGDAEKLTLKFASATKITGISSTPDFKVEQGSSCVEGNTYSANASCTLLVRFTPRGPAQRSGKLTISHSASATPFYVGLSGYGTGPIVSFTPSIITTVPTTYPSNKGLFSGASNLAVDGGDTVYVADTGNNVIRFLNASGAFQTFNAQIPYTSPIGVAVDDFGSVIETQDNPDYIIVNTYNAASSYQPSSTGCNFGTTCSLFDPGIPFYKPGSLAYDRSGNTFVNTPYELLRLSQGTDGFLDATPLQQNYNYSSNGNPLPIAVDSSDNTYTYFQSNGNCLISSQSYYSAANSLYQSRKVAGGSSACGFGGDGGPARNALISTYVGQMTFDIAGNFYFSDAANQRVRRIDAATGIITTIAGSGPTTIGGTGTAGYTGDGGAATNATLSYPTGLGVDSQGQVYILSYAAATGSTQVLRKIGVTGLLSFGNQPKGTASAAKTITMANTGNADLALANVSISGTSAASFTIDPTNTNCNLAVNAVLSSGQSCKIGIIFKPSAAGTSNATLVLQDNSVNGSNTVNLTGSSTQPTAALTITAPATGTTVAAGASVTMTVTVTSTTTPAPTGTVKFTLSGATYGSPVTISGGSASITFTNLTAGTRTLGATYSGDANYAATGPVTRSVTVTAATKVPATVTLKAKTNPATSCSPATFAVSVAGKSQGQIPVGAIPTGQVALMEGNTQLASGPVANGIASLTVPTLRAGSHTLTAHYGGDGNHIPATSTPLNEVVTQGGSCKTTPTGPTRTPLAPN